MTGEYVQPSLGRITVGELAPDWLARKKQGTAPSHYRMLESAWRVHVRDRSASRASICSASRNGLQAWAARAPARPR